MCLQIQSKRFFLYTSMQPKQTAVVGRIGKFMEYTHATFLSNYVQFHSPLCGESWAGMVGLDHLLTGYQEGLAVEDTDPGCWPGGEGVLEVGSKMKDKGAAMLEDKRRTNYELIGLHRFQTGVDNPARKM